MLRLLNTRRSRQLLLWPLLNTSRSRQLLWQLVNTRRTRQLLWRRLNTRGRGQLLRHLNSHCLGD
jgi:hypothetical protein